MQQTNISVLGDLTLRAGFSNGVLRVVLSNGEIWETEGDRLSVAFNAFLNAYGNRNN